MTVLLTTLNAKYIHTNLAIRLLYQLNRDWPGLDWREFTIKENQNEVARYCADYDVVAFSCYIWNITQTLTVARLIKAIRPEVRILLGGPEVSYDWENVIERPEVDYIVTGEGEIPFRQFLESFPQVQHLPNIVQKVDGQVLYFHKPGTVELTQYTDLMPYEADDPATLTNRVLYIETSRGCPYKCSFCLASLDNKVRYLPDKHIKATLLHLMQHGRVIKFLDRTFNIKRDFTIDIFQFILDHHQPGNVFQFEITADILHPDIVQFIQEKVPPGLLRFEIGIQTVNQKANLAVSRKQNFDKTKAIIESLSNKVEMHLDLIVGLPFDYFDDIRHSFETVFALYPPELQLGFLKFLKGTPVLHTHEQHGYVFDPEPPYQIIESQYLSREELRRIELVEHALELYWNKKRAPLTLRYVTEKHGIFNFFEGLGTWFGERHAFHQHTLPDIFNCLYNYIETHYAHDPVLRELAALDYYLYHKIAPKVQFLEEVDRHTRQRVLQDLGLNSQQFRHRVLPLSFDFEHFTKNYTIRPTPSYAVIEYSGTAICKTYALQLSAERLLV
jgi:anaerobic magnesium-protoporphyrin IX monomethyl ester cyclase